MPSTIITKNGSGAPLAADLVAGELAVDLTNGRLYTENSGGSVIEIGLNPSGNVDVTGTVTADGLTSDGGITIDESGTAINITNGDGLTQLGKFHGETTDGFVIEGKANNNLTLRTKANTAGEGIKFQDSAGNNMMFIDGTTDRVGIGTGSPDTLLNIASEVAPTFRIENTDTSLANAQTLGDIDFYQNDPSGTGVGVVSKIRSVNESTFQGQGALAFHTGTASGLSEAMRIDSSGNVGIGTASPSTGLDVGTTNYTYNGTTYDIYGRFGTSAGGIRLGYDSADGAGVIGVVGQNPLTFVTFNGTAWGERMRIDSSGNLGINQSNPSTTLHVGDGSDADRGVVTIEGAGGEHLIFSESSTHPYGANAFAIRPASGTSFIIQEDGASTPAVVVDTSGNFLVGTTETPATLITTSTTSHAGTGISDLGYLSVARDLTSFPGSGGVAFFNRLATDGPIADFRKDGSTVGSIGSASGGTGVLTIDSGATSKITLDGIIDVISSSWSANEQLSPTTSGVDLGNDTNGWQDLYLSGGVNQSTVLVSALPAASLSTGYRFMVSDSTVAASGNFGATVAGSGSNVVPVFSDGTNWLIG